MENQLRRGYSLTTTTDGTLVRSTEQLAEGQDIVTRLADGSVTSRVTGPGRGWRTDVSKSSEPTRRGTVPVDQLSYTEASRELDSIVDFFEQREVDVDVLVARFERATELIDELDRRLRRTRAQVEELVPRLDALGGRFGGAGRWVTCRKAIGSTSASCSRVATLRTGT